ncbi:hypothetical protein Btru_049984 [Bulinus truncatus]|nr:hypothetical protein Btru_049984 [Bulinus truncatus]
MVVKEWLGSSLKTAGKNESCCLFTNGVDIENSLDAVSSQLLKLRSCEFDIESIHTLTLKDMNLSDLGCISECLNLENLDSFK